MKEKEEEGKGLRGQSGGKVGGAITIIRSIINN